MILTFLFSFVHCPRTISARGGISEHTGQKITLVERDFRIYPSAISIMVAVESADSAHSLQLLRIKRFKNHLNF